MDISIPSQAGRARPCPALPCPALPSSPGLSIPSGRTRTARPSPPLWHYLHVEEEEADDLEEALECDPLPPHAFRAALGHHLLHALDVLLLLPSRRGNGACQSVRQAGRQFGSDAAGSAVAVGIRIQSDGWTYNTLSHSPHHRSLPTPPQPPPSSLHNPPTWSVLLKQWSCRTLSSESLSAPSRSVSKRRCTRASTRLS